MNRLLRRWRAVDTVGLALDFLNSLRYDGLVEPWVVGNLRGGYLNEAATLPPGTKVARDWIAGRVSRQLYCMVGEVAGAPQGTVTDVHVVSTRFITIMIPKLYLERALAMKASPAILVETERGYAVAWRLHNPVAPHIAKLYAGTLSAALGGSPLPFILPLPGSAGVGYQRYLKGPGNWTLLSELIPQAPRLQPSEPASPGSAMFRPSAPAIMLGAGSAGGQVYWAPLDTIIKPLNFGVLVTGDPGSGKTQTLNVLIDGVASMGLPVCIFDFKNDYSEPGFVHAIGLKVHDVRRAGLPFNPLLPTPDDKGQAQPIEHIFTIAGALARVFELGDIQAATLRNAMVVAFEQRGADPQSWVDVRSLAAPSFADVIAIIEGQKQNKLAAGLLHRLGALFQLGLFPKTDKQPVPFETMMDERLVLSLFSLPTDEIKAALAELIIIRLHGVLVQRAQPRKLTRLLVLDEAWRVATSPALANLAREGRAFGAGIAIGTQYPGDLPSDLAGALDTKIYLKNQMAEHKAEVVRALCGASTGPEAAGLHSMLAALTQFEGVIQNQHYSPFARFKLLPYFERPKSPRPRETPQAAVASLPASGTASWEGQPRPAQAAPKPRPAAVKRDRATEAAERWLAEKLADCRWHDSADILPYAEAEGIGKGTLYRARDNLGVITRPQPNSQRVDWRLPERETLQ